MREPSEFLDLIEWTWCQTANGLLLHAVHSFDGDDDLFPIGGTGVTVCGVKARLDIPGLLSGLGAPRCRKCCRLLGWPDGDGSPKNDDALRPLAEQRMGHWDGWQPKPDRCEPMKG